MTLCLLPIFSSHCSYVFFLSLFLSALRCISRSHSLLTRASLEGISNQFVDWLASSSVDIPNISGLSLATVTSQTRQYTHSLSPSLTHGYRKHRQQNVNALHQLHAECLCLALHSGEFCHGLVLSVHSLTSASRHSQTQSTSIALKYH